MPNRIVSVCGTLRARSHLSSYPQAKKEVCLQETAKVLEKFHFYCWRMKKLRYQSVAYQKVGCRRWVADEQSFKVAKLQSSKASSASPLLQGRSPEGMAIHSCSCLENPMNRRAWWNTVHRVAKSQTWPNNGICTHNELHTATNYFWEWNSIV